MEAWLDSFEIAAEFLVDPFLSLLHDFVRVLYTAAANARGPSS